VTVAKYTRLKNREENIGVRLLSSAAGSTNNFAGDGTTTSCVLAGEIVE
jgi:chaperonin GroEL (HSP60 family)